MTFLEFLSLYPKLFTLPNLRPQLDNVFLRHELCHFIERPLHKAFLPNFGFKENFGTPLTDSTTLKEFDYFMKVETRVLILETLCPFTWDPSDKQTYFSSQTTSMLHHFNRKKYYDNFHLEESKRLHRGIWMERFLERYRILEHDLSS